MRCLALLAVLLCSADAFAENRNERIRRAAGSDRTRSADDGRSSSSSSSSDGADLAGCCNGVCSVISFLDACSGPVTVLSPHEPAHHAVAPAGPPMGLELSVAGQWVPGDNVTFAGHVRLAVDAPLGAVFAMRGSVDHSSWLEAIPTRFDEGATVPAHWDHLPLTTSRFGLVLDLQSWEVAAFAGIRLLWTGEEPAVGLDGGVSAALLVGDWFGEASVAVLGFDGFWGLEPRFLAGRALGPLRLGVGWRHLHLFDGGLIPLTGPELSVGLKF